MTRKIQIDYKEAISELKEMRNSSRQHKETQKDYTETINEQREMQNDHKDAKQHNEMIWKNEDKEARWNKCEKM